MISSLGQFELGFIIGKSEAITYEFSDYQKEISLNNTDGKIYGDFKYKLGVITVNQMKLKDATEQIMI